MPRAHVAPPRARPPARPRASRSRRVARRAAREPEPDAARVVLNAQLEAQKARAEVTRRNVRETLERRERARAEAEAAAREEAERERRALAARRAAEIGGRAPYHRKAGPIACAAAATSAAAYASLLATIGAGDFFSSHAFASATSVSGDFAGRVAVAESGLTTLSVGVGLTLTSTLTFSALILFALAFQEAKNVIKNEPVIYYRCDGADPTCCVNGPHNKGYHERFVYMNHGRGFETRRVQCMRSHLRVSKGCSMLDPLIVYPKEEKWGFW